LTESLNGVQLLNMVQTSTAAPADRRGRNRLARHREYLDTALRVATEDGLHALTMQRLATEVDAAVGTVYTYFPSKGALVAEVQREAVDRLTGSYLLLRPVIEERVADLDPATAALAHLVGFARFCIESVDTLAQEQRLLQQLMYDADQLVPTEEGARVLPTVLRLLELARERLEAAAGADALRPGDPMDRTVVLAAALNGVLQVGKLARWDADLLDAGRLAGQLIDALLIGWGADPAHLAAGHEVIDAIARRQPLARPLTDATAAPAGLAPAAMAGPSHGDLA
jgi:AcrR family transcriptional regulator